MAKIIIKPNPNYSTLVNHIRYEKSSTSISESGMETTETENISKEFTRTPNTGFIICANRSVRLHGNLNTGQLLQEQANPYSEATSFSDSNLKDILQGKPTAKLQHILEYKHNKAYNFYTNQVPRNSSARKEAVELPALMTKDYTISLKDGATIVDTETEWGEVMHYVIKANSLVALNYEELSDKCPFYIALESEEAKIKQAKTIDKDRAGKVLIDLYDDAPEVLAEFIKAANLLKVSASKHSNYNELKTYVGKNGENAKLIIRLNDMYTSEDMRPQFMARVTLYDTRKAGIILEDGGTYAWQPPKDNEGMSRAQRVFDRMTGENSIIEFLTHPRFRKEQEEIQDQLSRYNKYSM